MMNNTFKAIEAYPSLTLWRFVANRIKKSIKFAAERLPVVSYPRGQVMRCIAAFIRGLFGFSANVLPLSIPSIFPVSGKGLVLSIVFYKKGVATVNKV